MIIESVRQYCHYEDYPASLGPSRAQRTRFAHTKINIVPFQQHKTLRVCVKCKYASIPRNVRFLSPELPEVSEEKSDTPTCLQKHCLTIRSPSTALELDSHSQRLSIRAEYPPCMSADLLGYGACSCTSRLASAVARVGSAPLSFVQAAILVCGRTALPSYHDM